jgi:BolA family transcriptional regulator, general stress-responsive regulator
MKETIENLLKDKLSAAYVEVLDESELHQGHREMAKAGTLARPAALPARQSGSPKGTHFAILIVADQFEGKSLIERHRMVHDVLKKQIKDGIHALTIKAYTTQEYSARN